MRDGLYKRAVQCLDAKIGLVSNNKDLLYDARFFKSTNVESLLTNVHKINEIPYRNVDAELYALDDRTLRAQVTMGDEICVCAGDFSAWEEECADIRYSLFGNLGLFFRYTLATLERYHGIYSFHASSLYIPSNNTLLLVFGGKGAGKTVYLLKGIIAGWKVVSTEMTHMRVSGEGVYFYKGSLYDNVRLGSLIYDFPEIADILGLTLPEVDDVWGYKIAVDLSAHAADDVYLNPRVQLLHARIESDRKRADIREVEKEDEVVRILHQNAGEKFSAPWLLYGKLPVPSCDTPKLSKERLRALRTFLEKVDRFPMKTIFAGAANCMDGVAV